MPLKKLIKSSKKAIAQMQEKMSRIKERAHDSLHDNHAKLPEDSTETVVVEISLWSAVKVILLIILILFLQNIVVELKDILLTFFFSLFIAVAMTPMVNKLQSKFRLPRSLSIILIYIIAITVLGLILGSIVPIMIEQVSEMADFLVAYLNDFLKGVPSEGVWSRFGPYLQNMIDQVDKQEIIKSLQSSLEALVSNLGDFASNALGVIISVVDGIFNLVLIVLLSFFMIMEEESLKRFFILLFPKNYEKYISAKTKGIQIKISEWLYGQIMLFFIVGFIAFIGLKIIGVDYALTLAMVAGLAEFLPYVGPAIAFITAAPIAFNESLMTGVWTIAFYVALQIFEGNVIVPMVMKKAVGLPPLVTIVALLIGWQFLGIIGMILSVPVASIIALFVDDFISRNR